MWRFIAIFLIGGIFGTGFGVALGFFLFPYVFPPPLATETLAAEERTQIVADGTFIHANPSDPIHYGSSYPSVVIWCAQFGVLISPADLIPK